MGFAMRLCLLLLISEVCVRANPVVPPTGLAHESPVPKSTNRQLFMMDDDEEVTEPETGDAGAAPTKPPSTTAPETTIAPSRSSVSTPSIILCLSALMPVFVVNKLGNN
ncbi:uncharacterized protein LOC119069287 [Bradysia coprophila]|uniref:uncharacterized protein LOC119069287 n=1 Tax=Bradysia coprophila TaxID=38358 RepID=UPI00187D9E27|nr:uncharacterized protein LOC119069287 [Bradysia coprophila]